jgi:apolipoprotein N-acyltransferase
MRSLELQRPMLRATNTGATVAIDHRAQVTHALAPHRRDVLQAQVQGRTGNTPYAAWAGRLGLAPLWVLGAALAALGFMRAPGHAGRRAPRR